MKMIYVEWEDSFSGKQGWYSIDEALLECRETAICKTIGYLIAENLNQVMIAQSIGMEEDSLHNIIHIPKTQIKKRKYIHI